MARVHEIVARLRAEGAGEYVSQVEDAAEATEGFESQTEESTDAAGSAWDGLDGKIGAITGTISGVGGAMEAFARKASEPNEALGRLERLTGESEDAMRDLVTEITEADPTFSPDDALDGMETLQDAGVDTLEAFEDLLPVFDEFADATGREMGEAVDMVDRVASAMGIPMEDMGEHLDTLTWMSEDAGIEMDRMTQLMRREAGAFEEVGLDVDDVAVAMAALREEGHRGPQATQAFQQALEEADGSVDEFWKHLDVSSDSLEDNREAVENAAGMTADLAEVHAESYTPMQRLQSRVDDLMFRYGGLAEAAGTVSPVLMAAWPVFQMGGPVLRGLRLAVMGLGRAMMFLATNPVGLIITAIGLLIAGIYLLWTNWDEVTDWLSDKVEMVMGWIYDKFGWIIDPIMDAVEVVKFLWDNWDEILGLVWDRVEDVVDSIGDAWDSLTDTIGDVWDGIVDVIKNGVNATISPVNSLIDALNGVSITLPTIPDWVPVVGGMGGQTIGLPNIPNVPTLNTGGRVPGGGPDRDSVLTALTPGEWVLRRGAAEALGPDTLAMLNQIDRIAPRRGRSALERMFGGDEAQPGILHRNMGGAVEFAGSQAGKPYRWGQVGPHGYDCSGFTSAIGNVLLNQYPHRRRHTTATVRHDPAFARNLASGFMIGVGNGHTSGTLAGTPVESTPPRVVVGSGARPHTHPMYSARYGHRALAGEDGAMMDFDDEGGGIPMWARPLLDAIANAFARAFGMEETGWASGAYINRPWRGIASVGEKEPEFVTPESQLASVIDERLAAAGAGTTVQIRVEGDVVDPEGWWARNERHLGRAVAQVISDETARR